MLPSLLLLQGYVHRVGRTGRAGQSGLALTLFTPQDQEFQEQLQDALAAQQQSAAAVAGAGAGAAEDSDSSPDESSSDSEDEQMEGGGRAAHRKAGAGQVRFVLCVLSELFA